MPAAVSGEWSSLEQYIWALYDSMIEYSLLMVVGSELH